MSKDKIILFDDKKNCCACGACMNICPKNAIKMQEDEYGFLYPQIDENKCVQCGACQKVCAYQNGQVGNTPIKCYAAVNKDKEELMKSASGGIFAAMATTILKDDGVVFGAALDFENGHAHPHHIAVREVSQVYRLQGSKYVQSAIENTYVEAKEELDLGKKVLFSGTPCQIAGLYSYLRKGYENLYTIDVICHGVPSAKFFDDYIQYMTKKNKAKAVISYSFRDKKKGWGMNNRIGFEYASGKKKNMYIPARLTSYNTFFLDGDIYRENCYQCPYAKRERTGDFTIGDYWGIEKEHPELLKRDEFDERKGISCFLVNTDKGLAFSKETKTKFYLEESSFSKIKKKNGQLNHASQKTKKRKNIMMRYKMEPYEKVEEWFHKVYRKQILVHTIYNKIPRKARLLMKNIILQVKKG